MEKQITKAYEVAEKDFEMKKEEAVAKLVKKYVHDSLEKIDVIDGKIKELEREKKELKVRLDDLKRGRLDLIKEKIDKLDDSYTKITPFIIIKEVPSRNMFDVWYETMHASGTSANFAWSASGTYLTSGGNLINFR